MKLEPLSFSEYKRLVGDNYPWDMENDDDLRESDWVIILWLNKFVIIHGFPGDNPAGLIFNQQEDLITEFGEGCEYKGDNKYVKGFLKWYQDKIDDDPKFFHIMDNEIDWGF